MDMVLLDWTRKGKAYCLAGAVAQAGQYRIVRPILVNARKEPVRVAGWPSFLLDGHMRWEAFELIAPEPAPAEPPHLEDVWVRALRPLRRLAAPAERRAILAATQPEPEELLFGAPLRPARSAHLAPGTGQRSLTTVVVPGEQIAFSAVQREGVAEPDVRVSLPLPGLSERVLPVKDHHLLRRAEQASRDLGGRLQALTLAVCQMGERVAVRLGLSRAFPGDPGRAPSACWLMADGFFSLTDPQP